MPTLPRWNTGCAGASVIPTIDMVSAWMTTPITASTSGSS